MIVLQRKEKLKKYQMLLRLEKKVKNPPFVAVLMRAREENGKITPKRLHDTLLAPLPLRACENLLNRLGDMGYFEFRGAGSNGVFCLTQKGEAAAQDQSYWDPERGAFVVYISESPLVQSLIGQKVIRIERVIPKSSDGAQAGGAAFIRDQMNRELTIIKKEGHSDKVRITNLEETTLFEGEEEVTMKIVVEEDIAELRFIWSKKDTAKGANADDQEKDAHEMEGKLPINLTERQVKAELLEKVFGDSYDREKEVVYAPFDPNNLALIRKVEIKEPIFRGVEFEPISMDKIRFIPSDEEQAYLWVVEWLSRYLDRYVWDDEDLRTYAKEKLSPIFEHYPTIISKISRQRIIEEFSKRADSFYFIAKLEAANYLSY